MTNGSIYQLLYQLCSNFSFEIVSQGTSLRKEHAISFRKSSTKRLLAVVYQGLLFKELKSCENFRDNKDNFSDSLIRWRSVAFIMHLSYAKRREDALRLNEILNHFFYRGK